MLKIPLSYRIENGRCYKCGEVTGRELRIHGLSFQAVENLAKECGYRTRRFVDKDSIEVFKDAATMPGAVAAAITRAAAQDFT